MMQGGYQQPGTTLVQQPGTTVVVVQQPTTWNSRYPPYMRNGIQMSGIVLSFPIVICLGLFGGFFVFSGIMTISMVHFIVPGLVMLVIGSLLIAACIALACKAKKSYNQVNNPGRIINRNPSPSPMHQPFNPMQPGGAPPYGAPHLGTQYSPVPTGMPPTEGYGPAPMGGYHPPYSGQPSPYPSYGAAPPYAASPGGEKAYPPPSAMNYSSPGLQVPPTTLPGMSGDSNNSSQSEYTAPPPYAPDYKPPY